MSNLLAEIVELIDEDPLSTGHGFTEGPVWHPDGYLMFTDEPYIYRLNVNNRDLAVIRKSTAGSNGMTLDLHGRLVMCDGLHRRISRMEPDGSIRTVAASWRGQQLASPNDLVFRSDGTLYFTDPGAWPRHTPATIPYDNYVYSVTSQGEVHQAAPFEYPNGLALSPDESILYVSNTRMHKHISAFSVLPDGSLANRRIFAELPQHGEPGVPDGMKVDTDGRVYCTGPGGVWVFDSAGQLIGKIRLPELPANLAWGDSTNRTLYVTARTSIYRVHMKATGTQMPKA